MTPIEPPDCCGTAEAHWCLSRMNATCVCGGVMRRVILESDGRDFLLCQVCRREAPEQMVLDAR